MERHAVQAPQDGGEPQQQPGGDQQQEQPVADGGDQQQEQVAGVGGQPAPNITATNQHNNCREIHTSCPRPAIPTMTPTILAQEQRRELTLATATARLDPESNSFACCRWPESSDCRCGGERSAAFHDFWNHLES